jgi:adenine phosphoribosyltransferase
MTWYQHVRNAPDFPKPGIDFADISPVLAEHHHAAAAGRDLANAITTLANGQHVDVLIAPEARGFLVATIAAMTLGCGIVPVRKPGKLPPPTHQHTYTTEYSTDTLHLPASINADGKTAVIVDDVLATGGTAAACADLARHAGYHVLGHVFLLDITAIPKPDTLTGPDTISLAPWPPTAA